MEKEGPPRVLATGFQGVLQCTSPSGATEARDRQGLDRSWKALMLVAGPASSAWKCRSFPVVLGFCGYECMRQASLTWYIALPALSTKNHGEPHVPRRYSAPSNQTPGQVA
jgi:hypothetical protein